MQNNPINRVDPSGKSHDWFENELTGDVYYNSTYKQGDESKIEGDGWKWMGKNGMFGKSDYDVIWSNKQYIDGGEPHLTGICKSNKIPSLEATQIIGASLTAMFSGSDAKLFMDKMGYNHQPIQATLYTLESKTITPMFNKIIEYTYGNETQINEKNRYMPKSFGLVSINEISNSIYEPGALLLSSERVARVQFVYSSNYYLKTAIKMLNLSQSLTGSHEDFQTKQYYGWQNYPYNTKLINKFRSLYGTK